MLQSYNYFLNTKTFSKKYYSNLFFESDETAGDTYLMTTLLLLLPVQCM